MCKILKFVALPIPEIINKKCNADHARMGVGGVLISLTLAMSPQVDKPLKSVPHGQCNTRPTVTFPAAEHHRPLAITKLYCLVTETHGC